MRQAFRFVFYAVVCLFLVFFGAMNSYGQSSHSGLYSFSFGFVHNDRLTNFNEQLLNDNHAPLSLNGWSTNFAMAVPIKKWSILGDLDLNINRNKPSLSQAAIQLSDVNISLGVGYDFLASERFSLRPSLSAGVGTMTLNFNFPDTTNSLNSILAGNTTISNVNSKLSFIINPKLQFSFFGKEGKGDGYLIETGYYYAPKRVSWSVSDVSYSRLSGFYFRVGLYFPTLR